MPSAKKRSFEIGPNINASDVVEKLMAKRTKASTRKAYRGKINSILDWLRLHDPESVDEEHKTIRIPLSQKSILNFFGHICKHAADLADKSVCSLDGSVPLSFSSVEGYRSALVDLYKLESIPFDQQVEARLKGLLDGYAKTINDLRKCGLLNNKEGKRDLTWSGYKLLSTKLMIQTPPRENKRKKNSTASQVNAQSWAGVPFAWTYFVLMWNLMSRSESIETIMLQHIDWNEDALVIEEQGHKGDQAGADKFGKHVYANPKEPSICPILAIAVLLFCCPGRGMDGRQQLFSGPSSSERFGKVFRKLVDKLTEEELQEVGCKANELGTHSVRKGSASFALGQVAGPTPVAVFLRMGQSLGKLKDRYIHPGEGADQLCGRISCGLPFSSEMFATLAPHFSKAILGSMDMSYWNTIVPGFSNYPKGVQRAFPFLLASVIHHESFLRNNLDSNHPIFAARVFTHNRLLQHQKGSTIVCTGECAYTGLKPTGIPPHVAIVKSIELQGEKVENLQTYVDTVGLKLGGIERQVGSIDSKVDALASVSLRGSGTNEQYSLFASQVAMHVCRQTQHFQRAPESVDLLTENVQSVSQINEEAHNPDNVQVPETGVYEDKSWWKTWFWNEDLSPHLVPFGWEFPSHLEMKLLWDLWYFGHRGTGIRPYRLLRRKFDIGKYGMRYTRAKGAVNFLNRIILEQNLLPEGVQSVSALTLAQSDLIYVEAFESAKKKLFRPISGASNHEGKSRHYERTYGTIYKLSLLHTKQL